MLSGIGPLGPEACEHLAAPVSPVRPRAASVRRAATGKCVVRSVGGETGEHLAIDTTVSIAAIITVGNGGDHIIGSAAKTADTGPADQESTVHQCRGKC